MTIPRPLRSLLCATVAGLVGLCAAAPALSAGQHAGHAHVHGVAGLELVVEVRQLTIRLEAPLDNLVGFERAPRNAAERQRVDAAVAALRAADLFVIDPAAGCSLRSVELSSAVLGLGQTAAGRAVEDGHAELSADLAFDCRDAGKAGFVTVGMFKAFPRLRQLDVQGVTPSGQFARTMKRPASRLELKTR